MPAKRAESPDRECTRACKTEEKVTQWNEKTECEQDEEGTAHDINSSRIGATKRRRDEAICFDAADETGLGSPALQGEVAEWSKAALC